MKLQKLRLQNFRNYELKELELGERTLVVGPNGVGKSNLIEAIVLLARGESFRAGKIEEMVRWGNEVGRVKGRFTEGAEGRRESTDIEVVLTTSKARYLVNGVARRRMDLVGKLVVVLFRPEDLWLIEGGPSERRRWLDEVLSGVDREYLRSLLSYEKALRRRNKILDLIREGEVNRTQLVFWDGLLIRHGTVLTLKRRELVEAVNYFWQEGKTELKLEYDFSGISETRLVQYKDEEVAAGYTLVGPHKDELVFKQGEPRKSRDLAIYGSRGEQRMTVMWLKMAELGFIKTKLKEQPVLLLDDIFSELDEQHRQVVWRLAERQQTVMTTTDVELMRQKKGMKVIKL